MLGGGEDRVLRELKETLERELRRLALLYRIFGRVKSNERIMEKVDRKSYSTSGRRIRDLFGLRVTVYFTDDMEYVRRLSERLFQRVESTIDLPGADVFGPVRFNLVFRLPEWARKGCGVDWNSKLLDSTFELQVRTVFSEGWHEVEHDLRYKAAQDWRGSEDLSRVLNGILGTVETCEWGMAKVFADLSRRHYEAGRWDAMLRTKMRLRLAEGDLDDEVFQAVQRETVLQKYLFEMQRSMLIDALLESGAEFPMTMSNICFAANRLGRISEKVRRLEPESLEARMASCRFVDF